MYIALFRFEALALYRLILPCMPIRTVRQKNNGHIHIFLGADEKRNGRMQHIIYFLCVECGLRKWCARTICNNVAVEVLYCDKDLFFCEEKERKKNCIYKSIRLYEPRSTGFSWTDIRDEILPCTKSQRVNAVSASILRYYMNKPCISSVNRNKYIGPPNLKSWWWP